MITEKKIAWTPELLQECRNERGVVLGMMSQEAQEAIAAQGGKGNLEIYVAGGWLGGQFTVAWKDNVYRLSPDWTPDELREKAWEDADVDANLEFNRPKSRCVWPIHHAAYLPEFIGYVYSDGSLDILPRRISDGTKPAEIPVAVRLSKGGAK